MDNETTGQGKSDAEVNDVSQDAMENLWALLSKLGVHGPGFMWSTLFRAPAGLEVPSVESQRWSRAHPGYSPIKQVHTPFQETRQRHTGHFVLAA